MKGKHQLVELSKLNDNPFRNFQSDPIDGPAVKRLTESIKDSGFWGGVVCRKAVNGSYEIAAGHHRVRAALEAGETKASVFIAQLSDEDMIRVYAQENATQRGNEGTAITGSVASAVKFLTKQILDPVSPEFGRNPDRLLKLQGNLTSGKGLGKDAILEFLKNVEGIDKHVVGDQLANLKESGLYTKLVTEAAEEVLATAEDKKIQGLAKCAIREAKRIKRRFDLEGCREYFKRTTQLKAFRDFCLQESVTPYLSLRGQAALAKGVREDIGTTELTGPLIKARAYGMLFKVKKPKTVKNLEWEDQAKEIQKEFVKALGAAISAGTRLKELGDKWPAKRAFPITGEFRDAIADMRKVIEQLNKRI